MADLGQVGVRVPLPFGYDSGHGPPDYVQGAWLRTLGLAAGSPAEYSPATASLTVVLGPVAFPYQARPLVFDTQAARLALPVVLQSGTSAFNHLRTCIGLWQRRFQSEGYLPACDPQDYIALQGQVLHPFPGSVTVTVYGWLDKQVYVRARLDEEGHWSGEVPPGIYGVVYQSDGYQPLAHGPYVMALP